MKVTNDEQKPFLRLINNYLLLTYACMHMHMCVCMCVCVCMCAHSGHSKTLKLSFGFVITGITPIANKMHSQLYAWPWNYGFHYFQIQWSTVSVSLSCSKWSSCSISNDIDFWIFVLPSYPLPSIFTILFITLFYSLSIDNLSV